jgi:lipoprotein-releasing system ATP-binding protein
MHNNPLLAVRDIKRSYAIAGSSAAVPVLNDVQLELQPAEAVAIVGPSGSGKSTLLNIIGTLDKPDAGKVELEGLDLGALDERQLADVRSRKLGFIFQFHYLLPQCTVWENVLVPTLAQAAGKPKNSNQRARQLLDRVGLSARLNHQPGQLSGGERQRVAVVRALINQPKLLLADEPTGALDRHNAGELINLLLELNREEGVAMIVVTHARDLAAKLGRVLELRDGSLQEVQGKALTE